jgi:membrane fusion protein, heavy metal efflux system
VTHDAEFRMRPAVALAVAMVLLGVGGATTYFLIHLREGWNAPLKTSAPSTPPPATAAPGANVAAQPAVRQPSSTDRLPDVVVPLGEEAIARAGIRTSVVDAVRGTSDIRVPGIVEPNAYKQVAVTALVSGRVTHVSTELGAHVKRGQPIAQVYSPELAEAQTKFVAAQAMLGAHDRELQRTENLVAIGAASRQELERAHAEHTAQLADLETARSRLLLLGVSAETVEGLRAGKGVGTTATISAPLDGVVTERLANVGLNVDPSTKLFTIVDLATIWVVADVYEKDLSRVPIGASVTITTAAYPDRRLEGRASYIDPQVSSATRTAKVRIEVANPRGELRLGMYATVCIHTATSGTAIFIPQTAVQQVGDRQVVYLKLPDSGTFVEREIRSLRTVGDRVEVLSGLQLGDTVVSDGSFFVRAERERLGVRPPTGAASTQRDPNSAAPQTPAQSDVGNARVEVTERGFDPSSLRLRADVPARVTFFRSTDNTCAKEIVFPSMNIRRALPLNQPVVIEFTPQRGQIAFACGINMLKGTIVIE